MDSLIPFSVVLLAGGKGVRMNAPLPKQYLTIHHKIIALYSFEVFLQMPEVQRIVIVCDPAYQHVFESVPSHIPLDFALPGSERQDSVYHAIQKLKHNPLVCIHDAVRPCISPVLVRKVVQAAAESGAAFLGVPSKATVKMRINHVSSFQTLPRHDLWEAQTPQVIDLNLLKQAFLYAHEHSLTVTDDVSLIELLELPVKLVEGEDRNIKITTSTDLQLAHLLLSSSCIPIN